MNSIKQPTSEVSKSPLPSTSVWNMMLPWVVSFVVSLSIFLIILVMLPMEPWYAWKGVVSQYITGGEYILADAGVMGDNYFDIIVHRAYLRKPGWLVFSAVYFANDKNCSEIFEISDYLPAGNVKDATIRVPNIPPNQLEDTTNQPALPPGTQIIVSIVYDTDGSREFKNPTFVTDKHGDRIFAKTKIGMVK